MTNKLPPGTYHAKMCAVSLDAKGNINCTMQVTDGPASGMLVEGTVKLPEEAFSSIASYKPDYTHTCEVCGANHVVTAIKDGMVVYQGTMCGVCTWGESAMADPEEWNK